MERKSKSADIRARLNFPVVDADGHMFHFSHTHLDYVRKIGGPDFAQRYQSRFSESLVGAPTKGGYWISSNDLSWEQRRDVRMRRGGWWGVPTKNTLDAATAVSPQLLYDRLDQLGFDFTILYGSGSLPLELDEETRRVTCRAFNAMQADVYREYADRVTPAAIIPMYSPREAIQELEYAIKELGLKVIMIPTGVPRPIPAIHRESPNAFPDACWVDNYGLDSEYDYDPFWAKCVELKVAVTAHGGVVRNLPWFGRSISSFTYNHVGNHAYLQGMLCKSLFLGGVTRRFPGLNFGFLEGGAGWACTMFSELVGAWDRRNVQALENTKPANLDRRGYLDLVARYGGKAAGGKMDVIERLLDKQNTLVDKASVDEWAALKISAREELRDLFAPSFYFGCEADDPITAWAFNTRINPFGARLNAIFGSDISHYDVPDMARVVEEAYELVEKGIFSDQDLKDFLFGNPVKLHAGMNPDFFKGTPVEGEARKLLAGTGAPGR